MLTLNTKHHNVLYYIVSMYWATTCCESIVLLDGRKKKILGMYTKSHLQPFSQTNVQSYFPPFYFWKRYYHNMQERQQYPVHILHHIPSMIYCFYDCDLSLHVYCLWRRFYHKRNKIGKQVYIVIKASLFREQPNVSHLSFLFGNKWCSFTDEIFHCNNKDVVSMPCALHVQLFVIKCRKEEDQFKALVILIRCWRIF